MRIEEDIKLDFDDVLIKPKRSTLKSRKAVDIERVFTFKHSKKSWVGVPIIAANMDTTGTFEIGDVLKKYHMSTAMHKFYTNKDWDNYDGHENYTIPSIGASDKDFEWYKEFVIKYPKYNIVCVDVANGYGEYFVDFIKKMRQEFSDKTIIAGNVATSEMTEQLILSGADIVKVGIGPGSGCTTRLKTGIGVPQLSAVMECADAAHGLGGHIIADGGCSTPADIAKAYAAGADFVMLGGMLAGHDESAGEKEEEIYQDGFIWSNGQYKPIYKKREFKTFYGMSSNTAQKKYYGGQKEYRASEGRTVRVPYRGSVENTIQEILGGLRSTCTYVGAPGLKQLSKCTTFIKVNNTHNRVFIDKEI